MVPWWFIELYSWFFLRASQRTEEGVQGWSASSPPASSRWSPPRPRCGRQAVCWWGSRGHRGRSAKPLTPVSSEPLPTWENQKIYDAKYASKKCLKEIQFWCFLPFPLLFCLLCFLHHFQNDGRIPAIVHSVKIALKLKAIQTNKMVKTLGNGVHCHSTLNCQVTIIVTKSGSQLSEL